MDNAVRPLVMPVAVETADRGSRLGFFDQALLFATALQGWTLVSSVADWYDALPDYAIVDYFLQVAVVLLMAN